MMMTVMLIAVGLLQLPVDDSSVLLAHPPVASSSSSANKDDDLWSMSLASQKVDRIETAQQVSV